MQLIDRQAVAAYVLGQHDRFGFISVNGDNFALNRLPPKNLDRRVGPMLTSENLEPVAHRRNDGIVK